MAKADLLSILYSKEKSPLEFKFDSMMAPSMYNFLTQQDINELHYIANSVKYSSKIELKYKEIDRILSNRGFRKFHCGTNRIVYSYLEDQSFLIKVALDKVGMSDNPAEYRNQFILKPFVTKTFEVSPCGTVAMVERVEPITSKIEFASIAEDIFELINTCIIGKYVLEDIGTKYFMNWGLRKGFGAVLLDYTYVYELDGNKIFCNRPDPLSGTICNSPIDYDSGFNNLICPKCGKRYLAQQLETSVENKLILLKDEGEIEMKISLKRGRDVVSTFYTNDETDTIVRRGKKDLDNEMQVSLSRDENTIGDNTNLDFSGVCNTQFDQEDKGPQVRISGLGHRGIDISKIPTREEVESANLKAEKLSDKGFSDLLPEKISNEGITFDIIPGQYGSTSEKQEYSRDVELDVKSKFIEDQKEELESETIGVDMMAKLGILGESMLGVNEEDTVDVSSECTITEEETEDPIISKYSEEYGDSDEVESFERRKKVVRKEVLDNY